ncbi:MAG: hypothetical protein H0S79_01295 [Anaerolineaceae bacterium]|jgi:hypothetical protein|nr:hypothetical protein [Anaerolineaceae bacterium]
MDSKRSSLVKPTLDTPFKIDFEWWKNHDRDWRVYLRSFLCDEHQAIFENLNNDEMIDWVDPNTAEVTQVDGLQHILITHCARQEGFLTDKMALVDSAFRVFLSNGNKPLNANELGEILNRPADTILRTFSGFRVYKGIRPII